ncbi:MAG TPA: SDR family NAD(P)-dependent oxidoreductase, partial [Actinophytocola sp.]|uniref:SDR family NAD(P)-dependent oxidoreductase n=1 Tax=Actinophytocola sp. TaxID=1872138 RepID=UPI002DB9BA16
GRPRRAAVSSFGGTGTNAHAILEAAPAVPEPESAPAELVPWVLSARTDAALRTAAGRLHAWLAAHPDANPATVATELGFRSAFAHRAALVGESEVVHAGLAALAAGEPAPGLVTGQAGAGRVVFVFPGQGSQWVGMARGLLDSSPVFAARIAECDRALAPFVDWSLLEVLHGGELDRVDVVQPVLWAVLVSLAEVWRSVGVEPDAVVGHSQGEIAAAVVAGGLSLADGARVVALRSKAIAERLAGLGGMVSVAAPVGRVRELLVPYGDRVSVAAVNGPASVVLAGEPEALDAVLEACRAEDVRAKRIAVDYASHSAHVERIHDQLLDALAGIEPRTSAIPFLSTVDGEWVDTAGLDAGYWYRNLRQTVQFESASRTLLDGGYRFFVEVSPHPVLVPALGEVEGAVAIGTLRRDQGGLDRFLTSAAELWAHGGPLDLPTGGHADLPTYPFQHDRYWLDPATGPIADPADDRFWAAVEREDLTGLAEALAIDGADEESRATVGAALPVLSSWRRRHRDQSVVDGWRYRVTWRPVSGPTGPALSGTWLLVTGTGAEAEPYAAALRAAGAEVRVASRHELAGETDLAGVLSLLALDEPLAATLELIGALAGAEVRAPLWLATSGAVSTGDGDRLRHPAQAQVWGLGMVAGLELPDTWGGLIDLPEQLDDRAAAGLVAALAGIGTEDQLAVRRGGVFARRLVRAPAGTAGQRWSPHGTVLVTGGTGAIGGRLARWLAERGAERVVLASRRGPDAPGAAELAAELTALGTVVVLAACDVADRGQLADLLARYPVTAVLHAAGINQATPLTDMDPAELAEVVAAKVDGATNLDELIDTPLDAFVLFSSGAGVWGSGGQAGYAAANAHLDALARNRRDRGLAATSVAWGGWADGGMTDAAATERLARRGLRGMDPRLALSALEQAIAAGETCLTVADIDWERFVPAFTVSRTRPLIADLPEARRVLAEADEAAPDTGDSALRQRITALPEADRRPFLLDLVRTQAAGALGYPDPAPIEPDRAFRELGFDSVTAVDMRNRLRTATGTRLPTTAVFDYPTATALADHLLDRLLGTGTSAPATPAAADTDEPIAIIGMSCRFPGGVGSPEDLWRLVADGTDAISGFPADRGWDVDALYHPDPDHPGTSYAREGGFVEDVAGFDAPFFGISPREAVAMDPQQRLLLEASWEAFERAGLDPAGLRGSRSGVFVGASFVGYGVGGSAGGDAEGFFLFGTGTAGASGRISYTFGLEGPAVTVDTACSSSLTALHLACRALRQNECDLALAGGVAALVSPVSFTEFSRQRGLAADGRCKPFAAAADGIGWGEGVGLVLVERLSDAKRNGHRILAVVRGSAVNQDGASNGLTAPNGLAQQRVIRQALANARLAPSDVDAVEAHGTGTRLGDPIEASALLATYGQDRDTPLWLGSVKSNIGHTGSAAGIAGVIKMVLALRHGILPRTLHVDEPTPEVDWSAGAVQLLTEPVPWPDTGRPRRAAVSSFGGTGTNAHAILEAAPAVPEPESAPAELVPWVLSAR